MFSLGVRYGLSWSGYFVFIVGLFGDRNWWNDIFFYQLYVKLINGANLFVWRVEGDFIAVTARRRIKYLW